MSDNEDSDTPTPFEGEELDELAADPHANEEFEDCETPASVGAMIRDEVLPGLSAGAQRFLLVNPESEFGKRAAKKREKRAKAAKKPQVAEKRKAEALVNSDEEGGSTSRKKGPAASADPSFTVYVFVEAPPMPTPSTSTRKVSGSAAAPPVMKGPFFYNPDGSSYQSFKEQLATVLPCKEKLLLTAQIQWKYEKPANDMKKPLKDEHGFRAMSVSLGERKKDRVINIYMPPPKKDDTFWDTGEDDHIEKPFDYDLEATSITVPDAVSAKAQIAAIGANSAPLVESLKDHYPINNSPSFPGKRVYQNGKRYWELTTLHLQVWASGISQGKATLDSPPVSVHFSEQQKLKTPPEPMPQPQPPTEAALQLAASNVHPNMMPPFAAYPPNYQPPYFGFPPYQPPYYPPPGAPAPYPLLNPPHPHPNQPFYPHLQLPAYQQNAPVAFTASPQVSPRKALHLNIPLDDFCLRYGILDSDRAKLQLLEYRPGMPAVERLSKSEWSDGAGFSILGWDSFLDAHKQFMKDVRDGKWQAM